MGACIALLLLTTVYLGLQLSHRPSQQHGSPVELTLKKEDTVGGPNYIGYVKNNRDRTLYVTVRMSFSQTLIGEKDEVQSKFIQPNSIEEFKFRIWPTQTFKSMDVIEAK